MPGVVVVMMVIIITFYSNDQNSNPAEVYNFKFVKMAWKELKQIEKRMGMTILFTINFWLARFKLLAQSKLNG